MSKLTIFRSRKNMASKRLLSVLLLLVSSLPLAAQRGESDINPAPPPAPLTADEVIQKFTAREKEFKTARESYAFRQDWVLQTLDGNTPTGEYRLVTDVT